MHYSLFQIYSFVIIKIIFEIFSTSREEKFKIHAVRCKSINTFIIFSIPLNVYLRYLHIREDIYIHIHYCSNASEHMFAFDRMQFNKIIVRWICNDLILL